MTEYDAATYGERFAEVYDEWYGAMDTDAAVEFLAGLAGSGPVLELGVGTGRLALPLQTRGLEMHGIDASPAMLAKLRAKPGGDRIKLTVGDFAEAAEGTFSLVFIVFNTFFALLSQEHQLRCFRNVAERLTEDGVFVIDAFVPDLGRFDRGGRVGVAQVADDRVRLEVSVHDSVRQRVDSQLVVLSGKGVEFYPVNVRYAWPAEIDLMARLAGLRLRERWGGWQREPFEAASRSHVSVYERMPR